MREPSVPAYPRLMHCRLHINLPVERVIPSTEARKKSIKKYLSQFADFKVRIPKEQLDEVHNHAAQMGESTAAFMRRAIAETMERDKQMKGDN